MRRMILAVDDDPLILDLLSGFLWEYDVRTATSGAMALDLLGVLRPALILLDVGMPQMDGLETLSLIRNRSRRRATPVMMLSAAADRSTIAQAVAAGAVGYLRKPFVRETLIRRVSLQLSARQVIKLDASGPWPGSPFGGAGSRRT